MMKKTTLFLCFLLAGVLGLSAQQTFNDVNAQKRSVDAFHGISVSEGIELVLTKGDQNEVAVSAATPEFRDRIVTEVKDGILKIHFKPEIKLTKSEKKQRKDLKAYVSCKNIDELNASTGAHVKLSGAFTGSKIKMNANTGAIMSGELRLDELTISQSTGAIATFSGTVRQFTAAGSTGSIFKGEGLTTDNCNITTDTGAGVYITVQKQMAVKASTGGFVKYKGDGSVTDAKTNTGGMVKRI